MAKSINKQFLGVTFSIVLVLATLYTLSMASRVQSKLPYESKVISVDKIPSEAGEVPQDAYAGMKQQVEQMKSTGYVDAPDSAIPNSADIDKTNLVSFDELKQNSSFELSSPGWLPEDTIFIGGLPEGPNEDGRWDSVSLIYQTPKGELRVMQAHPLNGGAVYPEELATERVHAKPAVAFSMKGASRGRRWNSLAWNEDQTEFVVEGDLTFAQLKKVADSLR